MAEVRKKEIEDKYNTASIKKDSKKEVKVSSKEGKNNKKSMKNDKEKKSFYVRFCTFCHGVKSEFTKVHWTSKKDMVKYSIAAVFFIIFCSAFFYLIDVIFALIQSLF